MNDQDWIRQCTATRDGMLSPEEFAQFEQTLRDDPAARETYLRLAQIESLLEICPPVEIAVAETKVARFPVNIFAWCAAAAAMAVIATILVQSIFHSEKPNMDSPAAIATLIFAEGCDWGAGREPAEGERLQPGPIGIESGTAVIRFDGGAEMLLKGKSDVVLHTAGNGELVRGEVVVRAEDGAEGFVLRTPDGELVDLGREFAVKVEPSGASELHVLDGEVAYGDRANPKVLRAGHALRFDKKKGAPQEVAVNSPRFADAVRKAGPRSRADLMSAYEGFNHPEGERDLVDCNGGKGWAGPWRLRSDGERVQPSDEPTKPAMNIVHGEMNVTWPVRGGKLGMLALPSGMSVFVRDLAKPLKMNQDGITYLSFMVRETAEPGNQPLRHEDMRLTFRSSEDYFGDSLSFGCGRHSRSRVQTGRGISFTSPIIAPRGQSSLWIGKIVSRSEGEDEIYFRIFAEDEELGYAEPAAWHVSSRGVKLSTNFNRVLLTSNSPIGRIVDELRIGPTWRSVAPLPPID